MRIHTYRRRLTSDTWHFMQTCRWWPYWDHQSRTVFESKTKPTNGEFCNECIRKSKRKE